MCIPTLTKYSNKNFNVSINSKPVTMRTLTGDSIRLYIASYLHFNLTVAILRMTSQLESAKYSGCRGFRESCKFAI